MDLAPDTKTSATLLGKLRQETPDPAAWNDFINRYGKKIYTWCRKWEMQEADARDVTQIVLTKLTEKMRSFTYDPARSFHGWLKTITHHAWRDYLEAQRRPGMGSGDTQVLERLQTVEARDDLIEQLREEFRRDLLEEAMARVQSKVSAKAWRAFQLLAIEDRPGVAVAAELGMKYTAVFMAKIRVRDKIREEIAKLEASGPD